ncbi:MAG TPA: TonB-dependent receptor plug domain-containing protein, partial [Chitinophagaceae bacterium]|nr:TonB-dependent receptor plug domain-containing protein [Chitinophagaceae bacterium]
MKLTVLLMMVTTLQVTARSFGQTVSFTGREVPLKNLFTAIRKQAGYVVFYDNALLNSTHPVTINVKDRPIDSLLREVLQPQGLTFSIIDKTITLRKAVSPVLDPSGLSLLPPDVKGRIVDETGKPVSGVTILIKGTKRWIQTDLNGAFSIQNLPADAVLLLTAVNIEPMEVKVGGRQVLLIPVKTRINELDAIQVIAYGTTTRRMSTGSVGHVSSEEIAKQPVINPLQALQGRVPGMVVTQTSGLGSASFKVQIRGQNSLTFSSDPLFVIDGVPMMAGSGDTKNLGLNQNFMVTGLTQSPMFSLNPSDIESIDVLKDADATAIYGSQGANGVVLINTKRGKPGKTKFDINVYSGAGKV